MTDERFKKGLIRYAATDMSVMFLIMAAIEILSLLVIKSSTQLFYLSVVMIAALLVYMRWNFFGIFFAAAGGVTDGLFIEIANGTLSSSSFLKGAAVYGIGNAFTVVVMLYILLLGKERMKKSPVFIVMYVFMAFIAAAIGRTTVNLFFGLEQSGFFAVLIHHLSKEALNVLFAAIVLVFANRQNGMFEDQKEFFTSKNDRR